MAVRWLQRTVGIGIGIGRVKNKSNQMELDNGTCIPLHWQQCSPTNTEIQYRSTPFTSSVFSAFSSLNLCFVFFFLLCYEQMYSATHRLCDGFHLAVIRFSFIRFGSVSICLTLLLSFIFIAFKKGQTQINAFASLAFLVFFLRFNFQEGKTRDRYYWAFRTVEKVVTRRKIKQ